MDVKEHYDKHLGDFYSWMVGDFKSKQKEQQAFFANQHIFPEVSGIALDLGSGHGIQAVSLAKLGFVVKALDFNGKLLSELKTNAKGLAVEAIEDDIRNVKNYAEPIPELIVCAGDTITHLANKGEIQQLIKDCTEILAYNGKLLISLRDYTTYLTGNARFIPVKNDDNRILTCVLDYSAEHVSVTDLLHTKTALGWQQSVSSYQKIRLQIPELINYMQDSGLNIIYNKNINGMATIISQNICN